MSEYDIIVVGNGIHTPVVTGLHDKEKAIELAKEWFEENVKGRCEGEVMVVEKVTLIEKKFVEENPEEHEAQDIDFSFEDFFKSEAE